MIVTQLHPAAIAQGLRRHLLSGSLRMSERQTMLKSYTGEGIRRSVNKYFPREASEQSPLMEQRITRKLIDGRFIAYKERPQRTADEAYLDKSGELDHTMLELDRLTGLLGTAALLRRYDSDLQELVSDVITTFEPIWLEGNADPAGIAYPLAGAHAEADDQLWAVWTQANHFLCTRNGEVIPIVGNEELENPYGVLPVVWSHLMADTAGWWRRMATDIDNAQTSFNVIGTQLMLGALFQSLGQPVASGVDDRDQLVIGPYNLWKLPQEARFDFATPSSDLTRIIQIQRWIVESAAYANHMTIKWADTAGATSGEHQRILEVELTEAVMGDFSRLRKVERERFFIDREILSTQGISVSEEYHIDFTEPHIPLTPEQGRGEWEWKWANGLATKADWFRQNDPDRTPSDIREQLLEESPPTSPLTKLLERNPNA